MKTKTNLVSYFHLDKNSKRVDDAANYIEKRCQSAAREIKCWIKREGTSGMYLKNLIDTHVYIIQHRLPRYVEDAGAWDDASEAIQLRRITELVRS